MALLKNILLVYLLSLSLLSSSKEGYGFDEREIKRSHLHFNLTIQLSSLFPSSVCNTSTKANERKSTLKVVHNHGPCNKLNGDETKSPSHEEILQRDQSRVNSIHSRLSKNTVRGDVKQTDNTTTIPAKDGSMVSAGNYVVTVGLGTPKKDISLIFDTGSDLTWTQCEPCARYCYQQLEPIFDPSVSTTYANVSCSSTVCDSLQSGTGAASRCVGSTCVYSTLYAEDSYSVGFVAKETLTLTSSDIFPDFLFGCGQNNRGLYGKSAGFLGLGRDPISIVSQTSQKYKKYFSYCLPSSSSSTGHLTFGKASVLPKNTKFTPLSTLIADTSFYGLDVIALSVGGKRLSIPISVFSSAGAIIDTGTVITRLPPAAYSALRSTFKKFMSKYPTAPALSILDTCYDFTDYSFVTVPVISFVFNGGVEVSIDVTGILLGSSPKQICLAFAGNANEKDFAIIGNVQQKTLEVVYHVAGRRVGFAPDACS